MFKAERVYSSRNPHTGCVDWYFSAREGDLGPFDSKHGALKGLAEFIRNRVACGEDGGRSDHIQFRLALVPRDDYAGRMAYRFAGKY